MLHHFEFNDRYKNLSYASWGKLQVNLAEEKDSWVNLVSWLCQRMLVPK